MSLREINEQRRPIIAATVIPLLLFLLGFPLKAMPSSDEKPLALRNAHLELRQESAIITYDLVAKEGETYEVIASLVKEGDPSFRIPLKSTTGDIGEGKFAGTGRRIQWEYKKDLPKDFIGGPEYSVEISAKWVGGGGGGSWVYYVLGGAVIAGGAVALLGGKKGGGETSGNSASLPSSPPGRPF